MRPTLLRSTSPVIRVTTLRRLEVTEPPGPGWGRRPADAQLEAQSLRGLRLPQVMPNLARAVARRGHSRLLLSNLRRDLSVLERSKCRFAELRSHATAMSSWLVPLMAAACCVFFGVAAAELALPPLYVENGAPSVAVELFLTHGGSNVWITGCEHSLETPLLPPGPHPAHSV
jgi:hypothetical protein